MDLLTHVQFDESLVAKLRIVDGVELSVVDAVDVLDRGEPFVDQAVVRAVDRCRHAAARVVAAAVVTAATTPPQP